MNPDASFRNPILPGSFPDPSICRVGEDFYLVNSSFTYFPGLPLHHSRDLVNWELIGNALDRSEQCMGANNLRDVQTKGGIHAPSLRYHDGAFHIITTNVYLPPGENRETQFINFVLSTEDIHGPWSAPIIIEGAPGIDPDLFWDDDGRLYILGTHSPAQPRFPGEGEIWLQELDPQTFQLISKRHFLWRGACGGVWVEGPHLYKRDGRYYLLVAEGGTSFNHAVMIAVSDVITGPYQANPRNPILTTRHLSYDHWVHSVGHADLVELADGRSYFVALGIRGDTARGANMGRETHLLPVQWEREPFAWQAIKYEWPVVAPADGRPLRHTPIPFPTSPHRPPGEFFDDFTTSALGPAWNFRRLPLPGLVALDARPGWLRLRALPTRFAPRTRPPFLGFRQAESDFQFTARMQFSAGENGVEAGMAMLQEDDHWLTLTVVRETDKVWLQLWLAQPDAPPVQLARRELDNYAGEILLRITAGPERYDYAFAGGEHEPFTQVARSGSDRLLSRGYTGAYLGVYVTGNGRETSAYADFAWVRAEWRPR